MWRVFIIFAQLSDIILPLQALLSTAQPQGKRTLNLLLKMKRNFLLILLSIAHLAAMAQVKWNKSYQDYIDRHKDLAIEQMKKYRIPASITLAQGVFESGAGKSRLATRSHNHFGIKCHGWTGATTRYDDDAPNECFRAYRNVKESYEDHSRFLVNSPRYSRLFRLKITDYKGWAKGLKAAGYATNPRYAEKLIDIIECYKLYKYDKAKGYDKFMAEHGAESDLHPIYSFNKNYYIKARAGDTFKSLAKELDISRRKLARYNELDKNTVLDEGDIVYLKEKRSKAPKEYKGRLHTVANGESMYTISQLYGIKLKSLYKLNKMPANYQIKVGDKLRVR